MEEVFFIESKFNTELVGENSYQKAIRKIVMYKDLVDKYDLEDKMTGLNALLILENNNKFDPDNAVKVEIENETVGYLSKTDAKLFREQIIKMGLENKIYKCKAAAYGKRDSIGEIMKYGIWLNVELNNLIIGKEPRKKFLGIF